MSLGLNFDGDSEFSKLLDHRSDIDLTVAALELARDDDSKLDFRPTLDWIEQRADELAGPVAQATSERGVLGKLSGCLAESHGLCGDRQSYERAESSYLNRVIETRRGIPISLSLLYMAVGERLGMGLNGVAAPMHFLVRCETVDGPVFVDPFSRGRILTESECTKWISSLSNLPVEAIQPALQPAGPREIVIRMLNNLKTLHARQENWNAAWRVQRRLTALQPAVFQERLDLASISIQANRPGQAIDLLESCQQTCPVELREHIQHQLHEANRQLARWN